MCGRLPDVDEPAPASSHAAPLAVLLLVMVLALCALSAGGVWLWSRFRSDDGPAVVDAGVAEDPPYAEPPVDDTPSAEEIARQQEAAREAMRARFRPGPFVHVDGLLPSGLSALRRMRAGGAAARTMDTPWIVPGAELRPASAPSASGGPDLRLSQTADDALEVIPGVPSSLGLSSRAGVAGFWLSFQGYPGSFWLPAHASTELDLVHVEGTGDMTLSFGVDSPTRPDGSPAPADKPFFVNLSVAAQDADGHVSAPIVRRLSILPLGTGDVEVSLSMSEATDLDLYVVEPTGTVVYYGRDDSGAGGHLDLDANAACSNNMGVNAEHIYWGQYAAPAGSYVVRVAHFESCIHGAPVDYRVTVRACGETAVFSGRFEGEGDTNGCFSDPGSNRGWCQHVVSFDVAPCKQ